MVVIDRVTVKEELCTILQQEYVALLGQRGSDVETIIDELVNKKAPLAGMKFISVALPRKTDNGDEFENIFLSRLLRAIARVPPQGSLAQQTREVVQSYPATYTANSLIRIVLDTLGKDTSANYVVIVLHALAEIAEKPLKDLLMLLREYYDERNIDGASGKKLRILVGGDMRLWHLCCEKTPNRSPFNIAQLYFLDGLSCEELQMIGVCDSLDSAVVLRVLTDGVPSLVNEAIRIEEDPEDLTPFFGHLQENWKSLSFEAREVLQNITKGTIQFPECQADDQCFQIPIIEGYWEEAFWKGFLRM